jgi:hypothetical protein
MYYCSKRKLTINTMDNNVQFDEGLGAKTPSNSSKTGAVTKLFMKPGLAKDQKQANTTMVVVVVICVLLAAYFIQSTYFPGALSFGKQKGTGSYTTYLQQHGIPVTSSVPQSAPNQQ